MRYGGAVPIWSVEQGGRLTAIGATDEYSLSHWPQPISKKCAIAMMADLPAAHGGPYCRGTTGTCRKCETGMAGQKQKRLSELDACALVAVTIGPGSKT